MKNLFTPSLKPFIKWPGGKSSEIQRIIERSPQQIAGRFIEPFLGGGAVLLSVNPAVPALANDVCPELIDLYVAASVRDGEMKEYLDCLDQVWVGLIPKDSSWTEIAILLRSDGRGPEIAELVLEKTQELVARLTPGLLGEYCVRLRRDLPKKLSRVEVLEKRHQRSLPLDELANNLEGSCRSSFYMAVRHSYNLLRREQSDSRWRSALFFFLREFSYASMFRFNSRGDFNVPYGGIAYNRKPFLSKIQHLYSDGLRLRLQNTKFACEDFETFIDEAELNEQDFLFVDPPYDSDFSDYDNRSFSSTDQVRLERVLRKSPSKVMVVISDSPLIRSIYSNDHWRISSDPMFYKWTIKARNDRSAHHLTITKSL